MNESQTTRPGDPGGDGRWGYPARPAPGPHVGHPHQAGHGQANPPQNGHLEPVDPGPRPPSLRRAVTLMWVGALLNVPFLVVLLAMRSRLRQHPHPLQPDEIPLDDLNNMLYDAAILYVGLAAGLWALHAVTNKQGRHGARVSAVVFTVLEVLSLLLVLGAGWPGIVLGVGQTVLAVATCWFLSRPDSRHFFETARTYRRGKRQRRSSR